MSIINNSYFFYFVKKHDDDILKKKDLKLYNKIQNSCNIFGGLIFQLTVYTAIGNKYAPLLVGRLGYVSFEE